MKSLRDELVEGFRDGWGLFWAFRRGPRHVWHVLMKHVDRVKDQVKSIR